MAEEEGNDEGEEKTSAAAAAERCISSLAPAVANGTEGQPGGGGGGGGEGGGGEVGFGSSDSAMKALTSALELCVICARLGTIDVRAQVLRTLAARARHSCLTSLLAWEEEGAAKEETRRNAAALSAAAGANDESDDLPPRILTDSPKRGWGGGGREGHSVGGMLSLAAAAAGDVGTVNTPPPRKTMRQASVTTQLLASGELGKISTRDKCCFAQLFRFFFFFCEFSSSLSMHSPCALHQHQVYEATICDGDAR